VCRPSPSGDVGWGLPVMNAPIPAERKWPAPRCSRRCYRRAGRRRSGLLSGRGGGPVGVAPARAMAARSAGENRRCLPRKVHGTARRWRGGAATTPAPRAGPPPLPGCRAAADPMSRPTLGPGPVSRLCPGRDPRPRSRSRRGLHVRLLTRRLQQAAQGRLRQPRSAGRGSKRGPPRRRRATRVGTGRACGAFQSGGAATGLRRELVEHADQGSAARAGGFVVWIRVWIGSARVWIEGFVRHSARAAAGSSGGVDRACRTRRRGPGVPR
jgi:hypothetical protein